MNKDFKISFLGSGNVAFHLSNALYNRGFRIDTIYSRNIETATTLADQVSATATNEISKISKLSDLYIIAVNDDNILKVAESLIKEIPEVTIVHTSGTFNTEFLAQVTKHFGCFYPLQSLSKKRNIDHSTIPFCIMGSHPELESNLITLGNEISNRVEVVSDVTRQKLHLAAVFVNNFSNHMFTIAQTICEKENLDFNMLLPLLNETIDKLEHLSPIDAQTGPALRNDQRTIESHLSLLEENSEIRKLYNLITHHIQKTHEVSR